MPAVTDAFYPTPIFGRYSTRRQCFEQESLESTAISCPTVSQFVRKCLLVNQWIADGYIEANGAGTYTLGHVVAPNEEDPDFSFDLYPSGTTGYPLGHPAAEVGGDYRWEWAYAGWSIVLIYASPETEHHQLYIFSDFSYCASNSNLDFDHDGEPGGTISGFLVPEEIGVGEDAARLTCFVGEGDAGYTGDSIVVNGSYLSNAESPSDNAWNSNSPGLAVPGVDIDTFTVGPPTIEAGDSSAQIDLPTQIDIWNLVYIIISFRSEVTSGGFINYFIR